MLITTFIFFILFDATNARIGIALVLNFITMNILIVSSHIYDRLDESLMNITKDENNEIEDFAESHSKWLYLPVTTEKLLQEIDQKGYALLRTDNMFYFKKKKEPEIRTAYNIVFNHRVNKDYFTRKQEEGWKVKQTTNRLFNITLWTKDYTGDEKPSFFATRTEEIKSINHHLLYLISIISIYIFFVFVIIGSYYVLDNKPLTLLEVSLLVFVPFVFYCLSYIRGIIQLIGKKRRLNQKYLNTKC